MPGVSTSLAIQDKFTNTLNKATQGLNRVIKAMDAVDAKSLDVAPAKLWRDAQAAIQKTQEELEEYAKQMDKANRKANKHGDIWDRIKGSMAGIAVGAAIKETIALADKTTTTNARLSLIVDDGGSVEALNDKIFASAQRSRASYQTTADAVSKMGIMAADAFSVDNKLNTDELIRFTELINKQFTIAGTDQAGQDAAMLQLTQAMASGVLRGEELNSIFEQAPTIIQTIADHLNVPVGSIRSMAEEGKLTADVVKTAMLASADQIDERFKSMPMTFAQVWTNIQNILLQTFMPLIQAIGRGAQWLNDNWETVEPILVGVAAGAVTLAAGLGIQAAATWIATGAAKAFFTTLLTNPLTWIVLAIGLVVAALYNWVQSVGGVKIAWLIVCNALLTAWDAVRIGFTKGVNWIMNLFDTMSLGASTIGVAFANYFGDMKTNVLLILQGLANGAIDIINSLIEKLNKIPGVSIDTIQQVTFGTQAQIENEAKKSARNSELLAKAANMEKKIAQREANVSAMQVKARNEAEARAQEIAYKQAEAQAKSAAASDTYKFEGGTLDSVGEVGKISNDVNIADEDLKLMKDVAEMRYVQNFVSVTPTVTQTIGTVTQTADVNAMLSEAERITRDEMAADAEDIYY